MVLAGIKRTSQNTFLSVRVLYRAPQKSLEATRVSRLFLLLFLRFSFAFFPYCIIRQIERKLTRTENTVTALCRRLILRLIARAWRGIVNNFPFFGFRVLNQIEILFRVTVVQKGFCMVVLHIVFCRNHDKMLG